MDSESIWKKNFLFNNGTVDVSKNKRSKPKIYQKDIRGVDDLEVLEIQQRIENIHFKKRKYSKSPIFDNPFESVIEGFDLVMDNSGNFQKVENDVSSGVQTLNNDYSTAMNIVAQNASDTAATLKSVGSYTASVAGNTISSATSSIGNTVSSGISYSENSIAAINIYTDLSVVNMISNLIEPKDFADKELQEDLNNNSILVVQSYSGSGGCKSISQPYLAPAGPNYNTILNNNYNNSVLGSQTIANIPPNYTPNSIYTNNINQPTDYSSVAALEAQQVESTVNYTIDTIFNNPFVQFIIQNLRIIEYPFIYWRWFIKKIGIMWCNLVYTIISSFYKKKYSPPTDDEKRLVIANMNSILSFLFSVLITYNWFFLMYYDFNGEKINTYTFSAESLKNFNGFLNFIFQYVAYPLECMDWFMLNFLPKWTLRLFRTNMNFVFIITHTFFNYITLSSVGPAIVDLFYDSLKLFFNNNLRPWQPAMMHTYTSFWKSFFSFNKTASNITVRYSVTLSTYVFLHILIFYAQLQDLIPSYFKKSEGGSSVVSDIGSGLSTIGSFANSAENMASNAVQGVENAIGNAENAAMQGINQAASNIGNAASGIGDAISGMGELGKNNNKQHDVPKKEESQPAPHPAPQPAPHPAPQPAPHPAPQPAPHRTSRRRGGAILNAIGKGLGAAASGAAGVAASDVIGSLKNVMNPLTNLSKYLPSLPGLNALSTIGDALSNPFAGTIFGAIGNIIIAIIRFCLSQYLVNIAAFLVAFYLLWYSFFGIFWFSKLSLFDTIKEIDLFILKHSIDYVYETCVSTECKNRTIWERIKEVFVNITRFSFPFIFYVTIFFILINSCFEYTNTTTGMHSSPYIKYGMLTSSIIVIILVAIKCYISYVHKKF
jgi:outer membrane biosynthesis protein TonB